MGQWEVSRQPSNFSRLTKYIRTSHFAVEAQKIIERGLRESNAIDTESLCIVAGEKVGLLFLLLLLYHILIPFFLSSKVWSVRCDVHVMDDWGNVVDCAALATICALLHFRRPEVTISGNEVTVVSRAISPYCFFSSILV